MIDPQNITNYDRTEDELWEFLLFAIVVAGKNAKVQAEKLESFIDWISSEYMDEHGWDELPSIADALWWQVVTLKLFDSLRLVKMGQYERIGNAFVALAKDKPFLKTITIEGLERYKGIGPKTARFFILHSFKQAKCAVLDTHILKFLRNNDVPDVPDSTPQNMNVYKRLEKAFLDMVAETRYTVAEYDLLIWKKYSA